MKSLLATISAVLLMSYSCQESSRNQLNSEINKKLETNTFEQSTDTAKYTVDRPILFGKSEAYTINNCIVELHESADGRIIRVQKRTSEHKLKLEEFTDVNNDGKMRVADKDFFISENYKTDYSIPKFNNDEILVCFPLDPEYFLHENNLTKENEKTITKRYASFLKEIAVYRNESRQKIFNGLVDIVQISNDWYKLPRYDGVQGLGYKDFHVYLEDYDTSGIIGDSKGEINIHDSGLGGLNHYYINPTNIIIENITYDVDRDGVERAITSKDTLRFPPEKMKQALKKINQTYKHALKIAKDLY